MNLDQIFKHGCEAAQHLFNKQGEIHPMWICETKDGKIFPVMAEMPNNKDMIAFGLKKLFKEKQIERYVSLLEAWTVKADKDKGLPESFKLGASLASHPERREIIAITAEERGGKTKQGMFYILRPEHGKAKLSPLEEFPGVTAEGRFVGLLSN